MLIGISVPEEVMKRIEQKLTDGTLSVGENQFKRPGSLGLVSQDEIAVQARIVAYAYMRQRAMGKDEGPKTIERLRDEYARIKITSANQPLPGRPR